MTHRRRPTYIVHKSHPYVYRDYIMRIEADWSKLEEINREYDIWLRSNLSVDEFIWGDHDSGRFIDIAFKNEEDLLAFKLRFVL